jgi:DNA-binding MarR family transcriptional regulator
VAINQSAAEIDFGPMPNLMGYYLRRLQVAYRKHFMRVASELNILPNDVNAIVVIGLNPGLTPARLSMVLELDAAKITYILKMFEIRGLLVRKISEADGRSRTVYLTSAGRKFLSRLLKLAKMADSTFMDGRLTAAETEQFVALMAKLLGVRAAEAAERPSPTHS